MFWEERGLTEKAELIDSTEYAELRERREDSELTDSTEKREFTDTRENNPMPERAREEGDGTSDWRLKACRTNREQPY